ncbi:hypothetical protein KR032_005548, partial [Drosophila birchii]
IPTPIEAMRLANCQNYRFHQAETYPSIRTQVSRCDRNKTISWLADSLEAGGCGRPFDVKQEDAMLLWQQNLCKDTLGFYGVGEPKKQPEMVMFNKVLKASLDKANEAKRRPTRPSTPTPPPKNTLATIPVSDQICQAFFLNRESLQMELEQMPIVQQRLNPRSVLESVFCPDPVDANDPFGVDQHKTNIVTRAQALDMERPPKKKPHGLRRRHWYCPPVESRTVGEQNVCSQYEKYKLEARPREPAEQKEIMNPEPKDYDQLFQRFLKCFEPKPAPDPLRETYEICCGSIDSDGDDGQGGGNDQEGGGGRRGGFAHGDDDGGKGRDKGADKGADQGADGGTDDVGNKDKDKDGKRHGNKDKDTGKGTGKDKGKETGKETDKKTGKDADKDTGKDTANKTVRPSEEDIDKKNKEMKDKEKAKLPKEEDTKSHTDQLDDPDATNEEGKQKNKKEKGEAKDKDKEQGQKKVKDVQSPSQRRSTKDQPSKQPNWSNEHLQIDRLDRRSASVIKGMTPEVVEDGLDVFMDPFIIREGPTDKLKEMDEKTKDAEKEKKKKLYKNMIRRRLRRPSKKLEDKEDGQVCKPCPPIGCPCEICYIRDRCRGELHVPFIRDLMRADKKRQLREYCSQMRHREYIRTCSRKDPRAPSHKCDPITCDNIFCQNPRLGKHCECLEAVQDVQKLLAGKRGDQQLLQRVEHLRRRITERMCDCM